ncbi:MAG: aminotransferase class I/II-fold pyridoxal phosphate-dependent enzyme [Candidatus Thorarchaeota archaeon]|nr:aminotransferase class I/II-fold pyridoxal phosphate-dependent enzyme [Candidatus Thorarchaeota archaeon]
MKTIDLRSDTVTKPTDEMIQAIVKAHEKDRFGDDVIGEDEVVNELQEKAAQELGKEAALLVTSGTQGNVIALLAQTKRGDEIIVEEQSHTFMFEGGGMSVLGGLYPRPVKGVKGYILPETLRDAVRPDDAHYPQSGMVVVENTHNYAGGTVTTSQQVRELAEVAREYNLRIHCDGARLFNAAVALNVPAKKLVADVDSVQICLSKGLSAPVGSIVAGTEEFIHDAHRLRKKLGGGMRQAGIIAAPGIVALEKMINRLKDDHTNAKILYSHLSRIPDLEIEEPETNIIFVGLQNLDLDVPKLSQELKKRNILIYGEYGTRARFVTHRMISKEDILRTAEAVAEILVGKS